jgi:hypothetical protein
MTRAIENLNKTGIPVLQKANICVEFTATFDKGKQDELRCTNLSSEGMDKASVGPYILLKK